MPCLGFPHDDFIWSHHRVRVDRRVFLVAEEFMLGLKRNDNVSDWDGRNEECSAQTCCHVHNFLRVARPKMMYYQTDGN